MFTINTFFFLKGSTQQKEWHKVLFCYYVLIYSNILSNLNTNAYKLGYTHKLYYAMYRSKTWSIFSKKHSGWDRSYLSHSCHKLYYNVSIRENGSIIKNPHVTTCPMGKCVFNDLYLFSWVINKKKSQTAFL